MSRSRKASEEASKLVSISGRTATTVCCINVLMRRSSFHFELKETFAFKFAPVKNDTEFSF